MRPTAREGVVAVKARVAVLLIGLLGIGCSRGAKDPARDEKPTGERRASSPQAGPPTIRFFSDILPGGIEDGRIYLQIPTVAERGHVGDEALKIRESFFEAAVPGMQKWGEEHFASPEGGGYGGLIVPDKYLDRKYIAASAAYPIGQVLQLRTSDGVFPVRIARHEIHYGEGGGRHYFYAVAEAVDGAIPTTSQRVIASPDLLDCGHSCALSRVKPTDEEAQRVRAVAVEKLGVTYPSDTPEKYREERLEILKGRFTKSDGMQYVAIFSRHGEGRSGLGNWATYVLDSDFSLISVLGRDDYLRITPDGVADVDGDGLDEIWTDDGGYEGSAYSLWSLEKKTPPVVFGRIEWPYFGL
jgi:hypothetical protein